MGHSLVIVESPTKATKIQGYLGPGYVVESSRGHIRDLPTGAAEVPAKYKGEKWARTGVDIDGGFNPLYVVAADKKATLRGLKEALKGAKDVYLATDGDREGEAIAWHLQQELKPKVPVRRMVFHEITEDAIKDAVSHPRDIDTDLVDAQETRRILDRLYGYEVSPVLWKKVMPRLSAGRVQSVATRLVVDRERERIAFTAAGYWDIEATLDAGEGAEPQRFPARLSTVDGLRVAQGRDFDASGRLQAGVKGRGAAEQLVHLDEARARALAAALEATPMLVAAVEAKPYVRHPYAPFRTTTLQQEAGRKLGFTAQRTMSVAQELYEGGFITYMRTDSVELSGEAIRAARTQATKLYGADYVPPKPRIYTSKVKNAQEAHEAIRPAGSTFRTPRETGLSGDRFRLYELIWMRTVASQMTDARGESVAITLTSTATTGEDCTFVARGRTITFPGFLRAYVESVDDGMADDSQRRLPQLAEGRTVDVAALEPQGHETKPPARYTEPSLVAKLEELEIGRPSTYASIIRTITSRDYVFKKGAALVPTWLAFAVTRLLEEHFTKLVDYDFTAEMEQDLDKIANGEAERLQVLNDFYWGGAPGVDHLDHAGLHDLVNQLGDIDARALSTFPIGDMDSGIVVRVGRYGTYVEEVATEKRANVADDLPPDELTAEVARDLLARPMGEERALGLDTGSGLPIVARAGRFGPYVAEVLPDDAAKGAKPRTASLFASMDLQTVTLEDALRLLSLPRTVGTAEDGTAITAQNGRYGPYLKKGTDSRSLGSEDQIFSITLAEAEAIYAQPKQRGRAAAKPPLKELGPDPVSGKPMVVKDGRFGPYVTDGETNATLRRTDALETLTAERGAELLAEKRAKGPSTRKTAAKKTTATKTTSAKKTAAKKAPAKKTAATKATTTTSATKTATKKTATKKTTVKAAATRSTAAKTAAKKTTGGTVTKKTATAPTADPAGD
ncbi:type I DNA topoisomerase [Raineyella sp. LH-20]|uniref:type I DNA topoisomerase n=1 Tax=Raineyella sp. LH-20 TaxID=3081204 RepID=UPI0029549CBC|nr:type I DNA topoisomerase [Raineyella sp. LH-20]WOP20209.1 type I DNA topoisomerase [Raineyella sp. LH-20]